MITLPAEVAVVDPTGLKFLPLDEDGFSFVFHEYVHYLQNIATPSGFHSFRCAFDVWRLFRETILQDGTSSGSTTLSTQKQEWLNQYLALYSAIEGETDPGWSEDFSPDTVEIDDVLARPERRRLGGIQTLVTEIIIDGRAHDSKAGESKGFSYHFGAIAISEGIAFGLDQIVASGPKGYKAPAHDAPLIPYHMLGMLAARNCPGIPTTSVLSLGCLSLLWNDPAGELLHLFDLYNAAVGNGLSSRQAVERIVHARMPDIERLINDILQTDIPNFENEIRAHGTFERGMLRILDRFRTLLARRIAEPLLELSVVDDDGAIDLACARDLMESIPVCTILQEHGGGEDVVGRDTLLSYSTILEPASANDELALLYSALDYSAIHYADVGLDATADVDDYSCPFFTCCDLGMRRSAPERCRTQPWTSATWPGWPDGQTCWYGAAAKRIPHGSPLI